MMNSTNKSFSFDSAPNGSLTTLAPVAIVSPQYEYEPAEQEFASLWSDLDQSHHPSHVSPLHDPFSDGEDNSIQECSFEPGYPNGSSPSSGGIQEPSLSLENSCFVSYGRDNAMLRAMLMAPCGEALGEASFHARGR